MCHPFNVFALFDNKHNKSKRFKRTKDSKEKTSEMEIDYWNTINDE